MITSVKADVVVLDGITVAISEDMRSLARARARVLERERMIAQETGLLVFHFRDADSDWGDLLTGTMASDFYALMIDANRDLYRALGVPSFSDLSRRVLAEVS